MPHGLERDAVLAVVAALASACGFALSTSLQHRVSGATPHAVRRASAVLCFLVTQPRWLLGVTVGAGALALHATALRLGALALVQPVMVSGVVLAIPARAALAGHLPTRRELGCVSLTAAGLALFLVAASPTPSRALPPTGRAVGVVLAVLAVGILGAWLGSRLRAPRREAWLLGAASGVLFGLTAALLKLVVAAGEDEGLATVAAAWPLLALVAVGGLGMALNQRAYRIAALSVSLPVLSVVEVLVAGALGVALFGEAPARGSLALGLEAVALVAIGAGLASAIRPTTAQSEAAP